MYMCNFNQSCSEEGKGFQSKLLIDLARLGFCLSCNFFSCYSLFLNRAPGDAPGKITFP